jgi:hypothetical protein
MTFTKDLVVYRRGAGNGPTGQEFHGYQSDTRIELQDNWAYSMSNILIARMNN